MSGPADDLAWLALCIHQEARGEPDDGKAAVARVVLNRARHRPPYASDGTIKGTILWPNQFSWTSWAFQSGHYIKVAKTPAQVEARVAGIYADAVTSKAWSACERVAAAVLAGAYEGGDAYRKIGPDTLLYDNLAIARPAWADPAKHVCTIGHHDFFRP